LNSRFREAISFIAIILLAFSLRLAAIDNAPLFGDEAAHIVRAQRIVQGDLFAGLANQKWLFLLILSVFKPMGVEGMWIARVQSALASTVTVAAVVGLGTLLARRSLDRDAANRIGLLAGLLYAVMPLAVFHERQALVDSLMVALTTVAMVLTVGYCKRPRIWLPGLIALTLAAAYLTKAIAIPYFAIPIAAPLILVDNRRLMRRTLADGVIAVAAALGLALAINRLGVLSGTEIETRFTPVAQNIALLHPFQAETWRIIHSNFKDVVAALISYVGFVPLALLLLVEIWLIVREAPRALLFLLVPTLVLPLAPVVSRQVTAGKFLPPRYLLVALPSAVCLIGFSTHILLKRIGVQRRGVRRALWLVLVGQMALPGLWFALTAIRNPASIPLAEPDVEQYDWLYERDGTHPMANVLREEVAGSGAGHIYVMGPGLYETPLQAYLGPRTLTFASINQPEESRNATLAGWLAAGGPVFVFERQTRLDLIQSLGDVRLEPAGVYGYDDLYLYRVTGAQGDLAMQTYARLAGDPSFMGASYDSLAEAVAHDESPPAQVLVFPPDHAAALADRIDIPVAPLRVDAWPLTPAAAREALGQPGVGGGGDRIDTVLANEDQVDPAGTLRRALQQTLYWTGEESWHETLHRRRFVGGPFNPTLDPQAIVFEDAIHLTASAVLDAEAGPGEAVRIALRWQTETPVQDSFKLFVHLVDASGNLLAQHDAIPGGGMLPMTGWEPGEEVDDHFAIVIPDDAPAGSYEVRLGIYNPASGLRLRITSGSPQPDYAVIGRVTIRPRQ
jgi:4-amino-4-deoxy-L-arabinose transferase-like glycosyltransferase